METEASRRATADAISERRFSRVAAVAGTLVAVVGVVASVLATGAAPVARNVGVVVAVGSGVALLSFAFLGRGSMVPPLWLLTLVSALCTVPTRYPVTEAGGASSRVVRAGFLGLAIVVAAVVTQFASDRHLATPTAPGQLRRSVVALLTQIGSSSLGLVAVVAIVPGGANISYPWFFAGVLGLGGLLGVAALGFGRN